MEVKQSVISVGGHSVPGLTRDGLFLGEAPIDTYCWFRLNRIASNYAPQVLLDYSVLIESVFFDLEEVPSFPVFFQIEVILPDGQVLMVFRFEENNIVKFKDSYQIKVPTLPLQAGLKINCFSSHVLRSINLYCKLIQIIDVKNFSGASSSVG